MSGRAIVDRIVVADRHPATVVRPDGTVVEGARVVLTREELFVFEVAGGRVVEAARLAWTPGESQLGRGPWSVATGGGAWSVERGSGCGCSSPLKRFVPWTPWRVGRL